MNVDTIKIIQEIQELITDHMGDIVHNVILFGSRVEGTSSEHSDYDVLILLRKNPGGNIEREIYDVCYE